MFIETETTPNPNALKFLPGSQISTNGPVFFNNIYEARKLSSLALKLFQIYEVTNVFYGFDFITITKNEKASWSNLKPEILMVIMDHLVAGMPVFDNASHAVVSDLNIKDLSEIEKQIVAIIETRVRPSVAMDGGDIEYKKFQDGVVYLKLAGACQGCPSSTITLKDGIESLLQHFIPEVKEVVAIECDENTEES